MKVELVQATTNPIKLLTDIASICYGKESARFPDKLMKHLFENGHHSVFEHAYYTFKVESISRACLAQLTRHRHASYSVRSQRYCEEPMMEYITPDDINNHEHLNVAYEKTMAIIYDTYDYLLDCGVKKEDARFILPQATPTDLYMTCNLRELIHINNLRTHKSAQWEIRDLICNMVNLVTEISPELEFMFKHIREEE